jgi:excinuclease ABC subunit B
MYADRETESMKTAMGEMARRRSRQEAYNEEHGITPASIVKAIDGILTSVYERDYMGVPSVADAGEPFMTQAQIDARIAELGRDMKAAAANQEFEKAAGMRDQIKRLRARSLGVDDVALLPGGPGGQIS